MKRNLVQTVVSYDEIRAALGLPDEYEIVHVWQTMPEDAVHGALRVVIEGPGMPAAFTYGPHDGCHPKAIVWAPMTEIRERVEASERERFLTEA